MKTHTMLILSLLASALLVVISGCASPAKESIPEKPQTTTQNQIEKEIDPDHQAEQFPSNQEQTSEKKDIFHKIQRGIPFLIWLTNIMENQINGGLLRNTITFKRILSLKLVKSYKFL